MNQNLKDFYFLMINSERPKFRYKETSFSESKEDLMTYLSLNFKDSSDLDISRYTFEQFMEGVQITYDRNAETDTSFLYIRMFSGNSNLDELYAFLDSVNFTDAKGEGSLSEYLKNAKTLRDVEDVIGAFNETAAYLS